MLGVRIQDLLAWSTWCLRFVLACNMKHKHEIVTFGAWYKH
jgi:hypothetical protein